MHVLVLRIVILSSIQENECNPCWNWSVVGEETNLNNFKELPFQTLTNYDIENTLISGKGNFLLRWLTMIFKQS